MATVTEEQMINKLATHAAAVTGITTAFSFSENPDSLASEQLPAVVFYPEVSTSERRGFHNIWTNTFTINGILFVAPRMSKGATLRFLENRALVFPQRFRQKFQSESVMNDLLSLGTEIADLVSIRYGAGGQLLTYSATEYIGFVLEWMFKET